jgi:hypothetical protein
MNWKMWWAAHVAVVRQTRNAYRILVGKPVGKYWLERLEVGLIEVVRIGESNWIRSLEEDKWMEVVQDRRGWWLDGSDSGSSRMMIWWKWFRFVGMMVGWKWRRIVGVIGGWSGLRSLGVIGWLSGLKYFGVVGRWSGLGSLGVIGGWSRLGS